jgi:hypothetical protein
MQVGVLLFYALLALGMTYPLLAHWTHGVLGPPGDNFEYLYKLAWFKRALFDVHVSPWFMPDVFYPQGYHLALHEMSLTNVALGMPLTVLWGETVSYNALVLLSFVLSGFGAYLLVFRLTRERLAGLLSGVAYGFCAYRMAHLGAGHLNLLGTQWLPFLFLCLEQALRSRKVLSAALAGLFFALSALSSWYYAPMFGLFAALYVLWRARPWRERLFKRRMGLLLAVAALVALVLMLPSIVPTVQQWSQRGMAFSLREVDVFSASLGDWFVPNALHPLWGQRFASYYASSEDVPEHIISLSWVAMLLTGVALWPSQRRRPSSAWAVLFMVAVILALGTTLHVNGQRVYLAAPAWLERGFTAVIGWLANRLALHRMPSYYELRVPGAVYVPLPTLVFYLFLPFFDSMRVWSRFGLVAAFAVAVLGGLGAARLLSAVRRSGARVCLGALLVAAVVVELASAPFALGWSEVRAQPVDVWLKQQTSPGAVAVFPLWKAEHGAALYASTVHGKPVVYGYGAFFPISYRQVRPVLWEFPTAESIALLQDWGVRWVLVGAESYGAEWPAVQQRLEQADALRLVATFDEEPAYHTGWLAAALPDFGRAFIVDRVYVYEMQGGAR